MPQLDFRAAQLDDGPRLEAIRARAFEPVFSSFRTIMGQELYDLAQRREDEAQAAMLSTLLSGNAGWELFVAHVGGEVVGFVAAHLNHAPARRAYRKAGFTIEVPSVWMCRQL